MRGKSFAAYVINQCKGEYPWAIRWRFDQFQNQLIVFNKLR